MNRLKRIVTLLIVAITSVLVLTACADDVEIPRPTDKFFINDFADVIDDTTERYIYEKGKDYYYNDGTQVAVVTMKTIGSKTLEEFSINLARDWGLGDKEKDNGVLVLMVMNTRQIRIEVGNGLEGVLNDGKCGRFIRDGKTELSKDNFSEGIKIIYDDIIGELESPTEDIPEESDGIDSDQMLLIIICIVIGVFMLIVIMVNFIDGISGGSSGGSSWSSGGSSWSSGGDGGFSGGGGGFSGGGASGGF